MRILFCNKYNYPFSGTEVYLFELMELLRAHGHDVALFSMANSKGDSTPYDRNFVPLVDFKAKSEWWRRPGQAARAIYSQQARRKIREMICEFRPDVAHVRNIYHHLTPSILWELQAQRIPILYHVNDFKLLCPSYNLVSQGETCEACKGGAFWHALRPACYPGLGARITLTAEAYAQRWMGTYQKCVDLFLAPSHFVRDKFVEHGWNGNKFEELQHFQRTGDWAGTGPASDAALLYFGRLSAEKGVGDLLLAMQQLPDLRLVIAGDGPQKKDLQKKSADLGLTNVTFVGHVAQEERDRLIQQSRFTVLPSHAYETFGKTILESYAFGRAVVATDLGSRRELVQHGETGILYRCGNVAELVRSIRMLSSHPELAENMGRAGRELVERRHTPEGHYSKLLGLYEDLVAKKPSARKIPSASIRTWPWNAASAGVPPTASARMHIAFIGGRGVISKYSGIESYYEEVGRGLAEMGHEVTVYCRSYFTPASTEYKGMRLVRLPTIRSKHLETVVHTMLSTAHAMTQSYDLIHYHALGPALFSFVPRLWGAKTMVTVQGLDWQRKKWGRLASAVLRVGERASVRLPNATMVVSQALRSRYRGVHGIEPIYVPNGGILRERVQAQNLSEWGLQPGNYVLFLGRFSPEKGCHLLVEAFERLHTDVKLVMAGASSYCDDYSRKLQRHASEQIRMLGWVSGKALDELLTNAMIFVLPSDMEGLSLALLDAMGAGLCVLSSDVPENREVVEQAGFTFRSGDVLDLADRLRFLIANPAIREAAGRAARKRIAEQYQWPQITANIEKAYLETLGWPETAKKPPASAGQFAEKADAELRAG